VTENLSLELIKEEEHEKNEVRRINGSLKCENLFAY
jgi:hypothetical protein